MNKIFPLISLLAVCNLITNTCYAEYSLYNLKEITGKTDFSKKLKFSLSTEVYLGDFKVQMEKTTLKDVIDFLGSGNIFHHSDASESEYSICYNSNINNQIVNIKFSSGEMGGDDHTIGQLVVKLVEGKSLSHFKECSHMPINFSNISIAGRSWLLLEKNEIKKILGIPSSFKNSWWRYEYLKKLPQDGELISDFSLHFTNNRVKLIELSQVTSY